MKILSKKEYDEKASAQKLFILAKQEKKERERRRLIKEFHQEEFKAGVL